MPIRSLFILLLAACGLFAACLASAKNPQQAASPQKESAMQYPVIKTDAEWKKQLSDAQYRVLREQGTERAFTGEYWDHKGEGVYHCAGCNQPLYASTDKF